MGPVRFYEKPGCINNTRQKRLLAALGLEFEAHNLLTEAWTEQSLTPFFAGKPIAEWFNRASPRVKSGEINPEAIDTAAEALALLLADPLLIRRPLIASNDIHLSGFDAGEVEEAFGLAPGCIKAAGDLQGCAQPEGKGCPEP